MRGTIKLMAEYSSHPIWWASHESSNIGPIDPANLPISDKLRTRLNKWAEWYDSTLNLDDPSVSGFETVSDEMRFDQEGSEIWQSLTLELKGQFNVWYYSESRNILFTEKS